MKIMNLFGQDVIEIQVACLDLCNQIGKRKIQFDVGFDSNRAQLRNQHVVQRFNNEHSFQFALHHGEIEMAKLNGPVLAEIYSGPKQQQQTVNCFEH